MSTQKRVFKTLAKLLHKDYYLEDFLDGDIKEEMLYAFCAYGLVWISENDRVILTTQGEQCIHNYNLSVDLHKKPSKLI